MIVMTRDWNATRRVDVGGQHGEPYAYIDHEREISEGEINKVEMNAEGAVESHLT